MLVKYYLENAGNREKGVKLYLSFPPKYISLWLYFISFHLQEFLKIVTIILSVYLYMIRLPSILQLFSIIIVKSHVVFQMHICSL